MGGRTVVEVTDGVSIGGPESSTDAFMSMLLILSIYQQKTQTVELFDVAKTVLARAV